VLHGRRESDGGRIGAAAAEGGDVGVFVNALKSGHDDDLTVGQRLAHPGGGNAFDAGLGVRTVGDDADLGASETDGALAERLDGHRHEGDGNLFAR